jgi:hypothetical protein
MTLVTCPCCHGETQLAIYEPSMVLAPTFAFCCHCQGKGEIESEVPQAVEMTDPVRPPVSWLETWRSCFRWRP